MPVTRTFPLLVLACLLVCTAFAQQPADPTGLSLGAVILPKASPRHEYKFLFQAHGGIPPVKYTFSEGKLPMGLKLAEDGLLSGTPTGGVGDYKFTVSALDSSNPPQKAFRSYVLRVLQPMLMEWKRYPRVTGNRVDGSIVVSNNTEDDFDFTFVVLAVAENGRATAIGYQHFPLKSGVDSQEIPFGETLPKGAYALHLDAVSEVPAKDQIYRVRLQTKDKLLVTIGP
jgi:hypothetical protein